MANSLLTIDMITNEAVRLFTQSNAFLRNVDRQYDNQFANSGAKIGDTLRVRLPNDYIPGEGPAITPQGTNERSVTLTVATQRNIAIDFGAAEKTMSLDDFSERILAPGVNRLAAAVASDLITVVNSASNFVVPASSTATALGMPAAEDWLVAGAYLDNALSPKMDRKIILDPMSQAKVVAGLQGLFNPQRKISDQFETGVLTYDTLGFDWMSDQTIPVHTVGSLSAGTVDGAGQTGNTLKVTGVTGTLNAGDIITLPGVESINRLTGETYGVLAQFVVTDDVKEGDTSISIYPDIVPAPAQYNTVSASPANGAKITLVAPAGSRYRQNVAFYPEAFTMATADLYMPTQGVVAAARATFDGVSLRMVESYDITNDRNITRLDILYGFAAIRPEWAVKVPVPV